MAEEKVKKETAKTPPPEEVAEPIVESASLELCNLVASGMTMKEAKEKLGM